MAAPPCSSGVGPQELKSPDDAVDPKIEGCVAPTLQLHWS